MSAVDGPALDAYQGAAASCSAIRRASHSREQELEPLITSFANTHISAAMRTFTDAHRDWLTVVRLPAYAPDLNPAEGVWANIKNGLGNSLPATSVGRHRQEPAQENPVPPGPHWRVPRPDRTHPRTPAALDTRPQPFNPF